MTTRRLLASLVATLVSAGLFLVVAPAAADEWPVSLSDVGGEELYTHPDGSVTAAHCSSSDLPSIAATFSSSSNDLGVIAKTSANDGLYFCDQRRAVGADNTLFGVDSTNSQYEEVVAYHGDDRAWAQQLTVNCFGSTSKLTPERMVIGTDGYLYIISQAGCGYRYLSKLDPDDGTSAFPHKQVGNQSYNWLSAYSGGVVTHYSSNKLRYFGFDGTESPSVTITEGGEPMAATMSGKVYLVRTAWPNGSHQCYPTGAYTDKIVGYGPSGKVLDYSPALCTLVHSMASVLENGVAMTAWLDRYTPKVITLDASGGVLKNIQLPVNDGVHLFRSTYPYADELVSDTNGNAMLKRAYTRESGKWHGVQFTLLDPVTGFTLAQYSTDSLDLNTGFSVRRFALAGRKLYLNLSHCGEYNCYSNDPRYLHAIDFVELGMDYPRGAALGVQPEDNTLSYVALGDSFSSGEGVPPFSGSSACHRSEKAYARLLDQAPELGLSLQAFVACSGADTETLQTGMNGEPGQLEALSPDPDVITITIGGNDVDFEPFVIACVTTPDCSTSAYSDITGKIENTLPGSLDSLYEEIESQIGDETRVLVLGYPMMIRDPYTTPPSCAYLVVQERVATQGVINLLNQAIYNAVQRARSSGLTQFEFVDPNTPGSPFIGRELCYPGSYFNGVSVPTAYSFHPNEAGQAAYKKVVVSYLTQN